jgi:hypothetical protein
MTFLSLAVSAAALLDPFRGLDRSVLGLPGSFVAACAVVGAVGPSQGTARLVQNES